MWQNGAKVTFIENVCSTTAEKLLIEEVRGKMAQYLKLHKTGAK